MACDKKAAIIVGILAFVVAGVSLVYAGYYWGNLGLQGGGGRKDAFDHTTAKIIKREETYETRKNKFCKLVNGCTVMEPFTYESRTIFCRDNFVNCT